MPSVTLQWCLMYKQVVSQGRKIFLSSFLAVFKHMDSLLCLLACHVNSHVWLMACVVQYVSKIDVN